MSRLNVEVFDETRCPREREVRSVLPIDGAGYALASSRPCLRGSAGICVMHVGGCRYLPGVHIGDNVTAYPDLKVNTCGGRLALRA